MIILVPDQSSADGIERIAGGRLATKAVVVEPGALSPAQAVANARTKHGGEALGYVASNDALALEAIAAGADEALMLDPAGMVSSCNATNFFFVNDDVLHSSTGEYCFNGVTRANIIALARDNDIALRLGAFPLAMVHVAEEAFVTGTLGGVTPVRRIDGRDLAATPGPMTLRLRERYLDLMDAEAAA